MGKDLLTEPEGYPHHVLIINPKPLQARVGVLEIHAQLVRQIAELRNLEGELVERSIVSMRRCLSPPGPRGMLSSLRGPGPYPAAGSAYG